MPLQRIVLVVSQVFIIGFPLQWVITDILPDLEQFVFIADDPVVIIALP